MKALSALIVLALLAVSGQAFAQATPAGSAQAFEQVASQVRVQMLPGGKYANLTASDQRAVRDDLEKIQRLMQHRGPVTRMNRANFLRVYNLQEHVNGVLTGDLANRQACWQTSDVGTQLPASTTCESYAQLNRRNFKASSVCSNCQFFTATTGAC